MGKGDYLPLYDDNDTKIAAWILTNFTHNQMVEQIKIRRRNELFTDIRQRFGKLFEYFGKKVYVKRF